MAGLVKQAMEAYGTKFLTGFIPSKLERCEQSGQIRAHYTSQSGETGSDTYDSVMMAIGL